MGSYLKPVHVNVTASIQAYQGLLCREDIRLFVAASLQLHFRLNKACDTVEMFTFLDESLLMVEKLKTLCLSALCDLNCLVYTQNSR